MCAAPLWRLSPGARGLRSLAAASLVVAIVCSGAVWMARDTPAPAIPEALAATGGPVGEDGRPLAAEELASTAGQSGAATSPQTGQQSSGAPAEATTATVSVQGAVHSPGLVTVPAGARVAHVLAAAGGAREGAELRSLNLAQVVADGDQILVGMPGEPSGVFGAGAAVGGTGGSNGVNSGGGAPLGVGGAGALGPSGVMQGGAGSGNAGSLVNLNTAAATELEELPGVGPATAEAIVVHREAHGPFPSVDALDEVDGIGPAKLEKIRPHATV